MAITSELVEYLTQREPVFHGAAWPRNRAGLERLLTDDFWEVGASGVVYTRDEVLDSVSESVDEMDDSWRVQDLECRELADGVIAVTYVLHQRARSTRRLTIWSHRAGKWQVAYHQGTVAQPR